jgi:AraC-type DNA-binding domain-containing proteins
LNVSPKKIAELTNFFQIIKTLSENKQNRHRNAMIRNMFEIFLYGVDITLKPKYNLSKTRLSRKEELSIQFHQLLIQHFKEQRSVSFYASKLNVTSKYLSESIKEISGKTAGELIDEMIILEAKLLLKKHGITVAQVADELHFSDQFLFSKFFKKHTNLSPSQYRNQ